MTFLGLPLAPSHGNKIKRLVISLFMFSKSKGAVMRPSFVGAGCACSAAHSGGRCARRAAAPLCFAPRFAAVRCSRCFGLLSEYSHVLFHYKYVLFVVYIWLLRRFFVVLQRSRTGRPLVVLRLSEMTAKVCASSTRRRGFFSGRPRRFSFC